MRREALNDAAAPEGSVCEEPSRGAGSPVPGARPPFRLGNRPPLTALRAPLIFFVMADHALFTWNGFTVGGRRVNIHGSWDTMSVFFVLSGFLITALLLRDRETRGRVRLGRFWGHRALRLLPPLAIVIAGLAIYAVIVPVPDARDRLWGEILASGLYYQDWRYAFGHIPFNGFLAQAWSLSVEEQFYALWAVGIVLLLAWRGRKAAFWGAGAGVVASTVWRWWLLVGLDHPWRVGTSYVRLYYAIDTRGDGLFLGCMLGIAASMGYLEGLGRHARRVLAVAAAGGAITLLWVLVTTDVTDESVYVWGLPITCLSAVAIIAHLVASGDGRSAAVMSRKPLVWLGERTYTLYLVHWPVDLAISNPGTVTWPQWEVQILRVVVSLVIAQLSWVLVEEPLTRWRRREARAPAAREGVADALRAARSGNAGPGNAGPGNAGPGNASPGNAGPGNASPGNASPGNAPVPVEAQAG